MDFWRRLRAFASVEAPDAAKRHAFLASLPKTMKFEMQEADKQLYEMSYDVLKQKATEVASGAKQSNKARQQLISRCQAIGESNQSYVAALHQVGVIAYPDKEDAQTKNDVWYNVQISGSRDKHLVDRLMVGNSQADRPKFLDTAKRLLALNTNTVPDDSAALFAIGLQKLVNQKNEIEELKGLIADLLRKEVQDIRDMYIKQRSTPVIFAEKVDIFKEIAQKNGGNREVDRDADRANARNQPEKNVYYVPSTSDELCKYAKIIVNDKYVCALVDTGASVTVLSEEFYRMCNSPTLLNVSNDIKFVDAGGEPLTMLGKTEIAIAIGDCRVPFDV